MSVCGEAAADPALAPVLVGLGATGLSMAHPALPAVAAELAAVTLAECRTRAAAACAAADPEAARRAVRES
jgi:phosphotransferase system enzyme I (PtsI)